MKKLSILICLLLLGCMGCKSTPPVYTPLSTPQIKSAPPMPFALRLPVAPMATQQVTGTTNKITLAWDAPQFQNTAGYKLYQGSISKTYTNVYDVGSALLGIVNAAQGTNYFAATAYLTNGLESGFSAEISYILPAPTLNSNSVILTAIIQTNSTLNTNLWGNYYTYPSIVVSNGPALQFYRVDMFITKTNL